MNRLIIEIQGKLYPSNCGQPYKFVYKQEQPVHEYTPNKFELIENFGEIHLYKDNTLPCIKSKDSQLPLMRSNIVLLLGLTQQTLDSVINPLRKKKNEKNEKNEIMEIQIIKDRNKKIIVIVLFKFITFSEEFFLKNHFRIMEDKSHLIAFFLKDIVYLKLSKKQILQQYRSILLFGKIDSNPKQEWIEIPTCINCLEKIQSSISGINYNYIKNNYEESKPNLNCNVCKSLYNKTIKSKCKECSQEKDVWACLICSQIGCGRYKQGHAQQHFTQKNHLLSIQIETERVWNYLTDSFAHRIIKTQNNILNFPEYEFDENKVQIVQVVLLQYCSILTEQLQRQRVYYKKKLQQQEGKFKKQQNELKQQISKLEQIKKQKLKTAQNVKMKKIKLEIKKKQLKDRLGQQKQLNKVLQKNIKYTTKYVENENIKNKKKELEQLEKKISRAYTELDYT